VTTIVAQVIALLGTNERPASENELLGKVVNKFVNSLFNVVTKVTNRAVYTVMKTAPINNFRPKVVNRYVMIEVKPAIREVIKAGMASNTGMIINPYKDEKALNACDEILIKAMAVKVQSNHSTKGLK